MLGRNIILASTALVASLALTACDNNGGGGVGTLEIDPAMMSATHGSVTVERGGLADIVVNSLNLETGEFNVTLTLADGLTQVTMTEADVEGLEDFNFGSSGEEGIRVTLGENPDDEVRLYIGLLPGADEDALIADEDGADILDASLFAMAAIDPADSLGDDYYTYIVTGDQTQPGAMPGEGEATYDGISVVSIYHDGDVTHGHPMEGDANVVAHFGLEPTVDITLSGGHSGDSWDLSTPVPVTITDSLYEGIDQLTGVVDPEGGYCGSGCDWNEADVTGDVIGAFYGEGAEATAGVFGAAGNNGKYDVEIVGSFGAYEVEP